MRRSLHPDRMAEREGLLALRARPAGRCRCAATFFGAFRALSNQPIEYRGFESDRFHKSKRPHTGAFSIWRRGRDYSALRARPSGRCRCAATFFGAFRALSNQPIEYRGFESDRFHKSKRPHTGAFSIWRRGRDSNPRWAFDPYSLSRGAPSASRPPLLNDVKRCRRDYNEKQPELFKSLLRVARMSSPVRHRWHYPGNLWVKILPKLARTRQDWLVPSLWLCSSLMRS